MKVFTGRGSSAILVHLPAAWRTWGPGNLYAYLASRLTLDPNRHGSSCGAIQNDTPKGRLPINISLFSGSGVTSLISESWEYPKKSETGVT